MSNKDKLNLFMDILIEENNKYNLTAIKTKEEIKTKHFDDSLEILNLYSFEQNAKILDIGTGAGFPAIPISIYRPDLSMNLLDSVNKKTNFLKNVKDKLNLVNVNVINGRCEDLARDKKYRQKFDYVLARALAPLPTLLEYAVPFLKNKGIFFAYKSRSFDEELSLSKNAMNKLNVEIIDRYEYEIDGAIRYIVTFKKQKNTSNLYPRNVGIPKKKPL